MKKYTLLTVAPILALMAVGCSTPVAMQSTEYDDMYYSSSDKTEYVEPEATASAQPQQRQYDENTEQALAEGEVLNPEYSRSNATAGYETGDEYYDGRSYNPRDNWYQPSYSYVDPSWGMAYTPRMASYAYYDPFYDPFFDDPFYYNSFRRSPYWGNGLSISLSYGMGWGGGFYNRPYYSNWWPGSYGHSYYNGYRHGFYNGMYSNYYGGSPYGGFYDRPLVVSKPVMRQNAPRDSRGVVVTDNSGNRRAVRGGVNQGQEAVGTQSATRPARRGDRSGSEAITETQESKATLPSRPTRTEYYDPRSGQGRTTRQPATTTQQEQQQRVSPSRTERRTRTQEFKQAQPAQRQQERVRPVESTPTRTYESRPTRTYESSPAQSRPIQQSTPRSSGSSSGGGGGRPPRGQ
jgi:hypothetical protein